MLRVVTCYVPGMLRDETRDALERSLGASGQYLVDGEARQPDSLLTLEYVPIDPNDPLMYGQRIAQLWDESLRNGHDLALVEQDVEVGPTTLYDFRACQHRYCGNPYPWATDVGVALGCTRFRHAFIAAYPDAVDMALAVGPHFRNFDVVFQRRVLAFASGEQPHVHAPVVHLNEGKTLLPGANPEPLLGVPPDIGRVLAP